MVSKNFKVLAVIDEYEYVFSPFAFKALVRKYKADKKSKGETVTSEVALEEIANSAHVSVDAIKNWMYAKNGPADLETVKVIASFFEISYIELLRKQEKKTMSENKIITLDTKIDMERTKDVIRVVYQKMSAFMDAAVWELCFSSDEETFWRYEEVYKDMVATLHRSMLDIPIGIYDQLKTIAEGDLYTYMYGIPEAPCDVWDLSEFYDFCSAKNLDGEIARMYYMEEESEKFYARMREILKDYLLV